LLAGVLKALSRVLRHHLLDDPGKLGRHAGANMLDRHGVLVAMRLEFCEQR
jgi:hypothetical protein